MGREATGSASRPPPCSRWEQRAWPAQWPCRAPSILLRHTELQREEKGCSREASGSDALGSLSPECTGRGALSGDTLGQSPCPVSLLASPSLVPSECMVGPLCMTDTSKSTQTQDGCKHWCCPAGHSLLGRPALSFSLPRHRHSAASQHIHGYS